MHFKEVSKWTLNRVKCNSTFKNNGRQQTITRLQHIICIPKVELSFAGWRVLVRDEDEGKCRWLWPIACFPDLHCQTGHLGVKEW